MGLRRPGGTKEYEEMPGSNVPVSRIVGQQTIVDHHIDHPTIAPDLEMSSVSVVPDGKCLVVPLEELELIVASPSFRHIHGYSSGERVRIRMVSSEIVLMCWSVLDGRLDGDDDTECAWSSIAL